RHAGRDLRDILERYPATPGHIHIGPYHVHGWKAVARPYSLHKTLPLWFHDTRIGPWATVASTGPMRTTGLSVDAVLGPLRALHDALDNAVRPDKVNLGGVLDADEVAGGGRFLRAMGL